jgi:hypothetical protein
MTSMVRARLPPSCWGHRPCTSPPAPRISSSRFAHSLIFVLRSRSSGESDGKASSILARPCWQQVADRTVVPSPAPRGRHAPASRACRFAYVKLGSPIFWNFFSRNSVRWKYGLNFTLTNVVRKQGKTGRPHASERLQPDFLERNSRNSSAAWLIWEFQTTPPGGEME